MKQTRPPLARIIVPLEDDEVIIFNGKPHLNLGVHAAMCLGQVLDRHVRKEQARPKPEPMPAEVFSKLRFDFKSLVRLLQRFGPQSEEQLAKAFGLDNRRYLRRSLRQLQRRHTVEETADGRWAVAQVGQVDAERGIA